MKNPSKCAHISPDREFSILLGIWSTAKQGQTCREMGPESHGSLFLAFARQIEVCLERGYALWERLCLA